MAWTRNIIIVITIILTKYGAGGLNKLSAQRIILSHCSTVLERPINVNVKLTFCFHWSLIWTRNMGLKTQLGCEPQFKSLRLEWSHHPKIRLQFVYQYRSIEQFFYVHYSSKLIESNDYQEQFENKFLVSRVAWLTWPTVATCVPQWGQCLVCGWWAPGLGTSVVTWQHYGQRESQFSRAHYTSSELIKYKSQDWPQAIETEWA